MNVCYKSPSLIIQVVPYTIWDQTDLRGEAKSWNLVNIEHKGLMIMLDPNSLVRQKEGVQGEEAGDRKKAGSTAIPTPSANTSIGPTQ